MMRATQFSPGISFAVTMVNSCQGRSPVNSMFRILPRGTGLRSVTPCSMPGNERSSTYLDSPVTFCRPSFRGTGLPTVWNIIFLLYCVAYVAHARVRALRCEIKRGSILGLLVQPQRFHDRKPFRRARRLSL